MREVRYQSIILKKRPFGEADEIVTFFSREAGKIRGLAKSVKLPRAKLQNHLQNLFLTELTLAGWGRLPKITGAQSRLTFPLMRGNLELTKRAIYASELVLRFSPDGQKNEKLFDSLLGFLGFLNSLAGNEEAGLAKFKAEFLSAVGLSARAHDSLGANQVQLNLCKALETASFADLEKKDWGNVGALQKFLSEFIVFQLEREVESERFIDLI